MKDRYRGGFLGTSEFGNAFILDYDWVAIDANGLAHQAFHETYETIRGLSEEILEQLCFERIYQSIISLSTVFPPKLGLFISFDGTVPLPKIIQQRYRRVGAASRLILKDGTVVSEPSRFSRAVITTGTDWMGRLMEYLKDAMKREPIKPCSTLFQKLIVLSASFEPGEGEHKIVQFFKKFPPNVPVKIAVIGQDGDLTILTQIIALNLKRAEVSMIRIDPVMDDPTESQVSIIRSDVILKLLPVSLLDFTYLSFLIGNDFTPKQKFVFSIIKSFDQLLEENIPLVREDLSIDKDNLIKKLKLIPEFDLISRNSDFYKDFPDLLFKSSRGFEDYRRIYNEQFGTETEREDIDIVCMLYLRNLSWILRYYFKGETVPWREAYLYWHAPLLIDLIQFLEKISEKEWSCINHFEELPSASLTAAAKLLPSEPYSPLEHLRQVLGWRDRFLLPEELQDTVDKEDVFYVNRDGITKDHLQIVEIPPLSTIDVDIVVEGDEDKEAGTIIYLPVNIEKAIEVYPDILKASKQFQIKEMPVKLEEIVFFEDKWGVKNITEYSTTKEEQTRGIETVFSKLNEIEEINSIIDGTAHVGGDTLFFASDERRVVYACEIDLQAYAMLNLNIFERKLTNVFTYNVDVTEKNFKNKDLLYLDPPWGGRDYKKKASLMLLLSGKTMEEIILKISPKFWIVKVPKNFDSRTFGELKINRFDVVVRGRVVFYLIYGKL